MPPRQAIRELQIAMAVVLPVWSGALDAMIHASWERLQDDRVFVGLCAIASTLLFRLWMPAPEQTPPHDQSETADLR